MFFGLIYELLYYEFSDVTNNEWSIQLINDQKHVMIGKEYLATILCFGCVAVLGYLLVRFIPLEKQSPIVSAIGMAGMYLGFIVGTLWIIQTCSDFIHCIVPINSMLIFIKTIAMSIIC